MDFRDIRINHTKRILTAYLDWSATPTDGGTGLHSTRSSTSYKDGVVKDLDKDGRVNGEKAWIGLKKDLEYGRVYDDSTCFFDRLGEDEA